MKLQSPQQHSAGSDKLAFAPAADVWGWQFCSAPLSPALSTGCSQLELHLGSQVWGTLMCSVLAFEKNLLGLKEADVASSSRGGTAILKSTKLLEIRIT